VNSDIRRPDSADFNYFAPIVARVDKCASTPRGRAVYAAWCEFAPAVTGNGARRRVRRGGEVRDVVELAFLGATAGRVRWARQYGSDGNETGKETGCNRQRNW